MKLGSDGAEWRGPGGGRARAPAAAPSGRAVDTTGAGDAFAAGWIAARREGREPAAALERACALAATAVTRRGPGRRRAQSRSKTFRMLPSGSLNQAALAPGSVATPSSVVSPGKS